MNIRINRNVAAASMLFLIIGCSETQVSDVEYYENAEKYYETADYHSTVIELKNALKENSSFYDARFLLGTVYLDIGAGELAEKEFLRAESIGGKSSFLTYKIASALLVQRKYEDVIELESQLINQGVVEQQQALSYALLATAHLELDDVDMSRKLVDQALLLDETSLEIQLANIRTMVAEGRYENSRAEMAKLLEKYPKKAVVWYWQANMAFSRGEFKSAEKAFKQVIELEPEKPLTRRVFNSKIGLVRSYMLDQQIDKAKLISDELLRNKPKHPAVLYLSASVSYHQKDMDKAMTPLLEIVEKAPGYYPAAFLLGAVHYSKGNYEQANVELSRYLNEFPENPLAGKLFAAINLKLNKPEAVINMLGPALKKKGADADLMLMVGRASFQVGDTENALQYIKKAKLIAPESSDVSSELAKAYLNQGEHQLALDELKTIKDDTEEQAKVSMVLAYVQGRDFNSARALAKTLLDTHPDDSAYLVLLGSVELASGERLKARGYFENAVIKSPESIPAISNLARMDMQNEKFVSAKKGYERILNIEQNNIDAMFSLAQLAEQRGDIGQGAKWLEKIRQVDEEVLFPRLILGRYYLGQKDFVSALEIAEEAKKQHLHDPKLLLLLSQIYTGMGNNDTALLINRQLVDSMPKAPGAYFELAKTEIKLQSYESAKMNLEKALKLKPDYIHAKVLLSKVSLYVEDYDEALRLALDVQKTYPESPLGYKLAGLAYKGLGDLDNAENSFNRSVEISPSSDVVLLLARVYLEGDNVKKAETVLLGWLKKENKDIEAMLALAMLYQGNSNITKAERYYLQLLDYEPENIRALNNLAMLLLDKSESYEALKYAKQAYRLDSGNVFVKDTYGWCLILIGRLDEGMELVEDAASRTEHPSVQYHYAYGLKEQGEVEKARRVIGKVIDGGFDFSELDLARNLYQSL